VHVQPKGHRDGRQRPPPGWGRRGLPRHVPRAIHLRLTGRGRKRPARCLAGPRGRPGTRRFDLSREGGDFVVYKNVGQAAYQLAVVVDDAAAGVDAIVRGDDLLDSAARQDHLRRLLELSPRPRYWHLPLVIGPDGRRLAKRHGDTRLARYRKEGATPQRVLGLLGFWCGLLPARREATLDELLEGFDLALLPKEPVVFTPADDDFLLGR